MAFPLHTNRRGGADGTGGPAILDGIANLVRPGDGDLKIAIDPVDDDVDAAAIADCTPNAGPAAIPDTGTTHNQHAAVWPHLEPGALAGPIASDLDVEDEELVTSPRRRQLQLGDLNVLPELDGLPEREAAYARAARAENTLRWYRSDWADFTTWCTAHDAEPMPAGPAALTGYLVALAEAGAKVGTLSRRLSSIEFAHASAGHPDPATHPRVTAVWEGIRRVHGAPPEQAAPLMPPLLFDVLAACPTTRTWPTPATTTTSGRRSRSAMRAPEPDLLGARDRALLLVGFIGASRRSELAALDLADVAGHPNGLVLSLPRSKTNQTGEHAELVVLPRAGNPDRCPVTALQRWLELAGITEGPVFRGVKKANMAAQRRLHLESVTTLVKRALARAGAPTTGNSGHSLRAGFVTYAHLRGSSDRAIAHQTRHRSMASLGGYVRVAHAWTDNAATSLGLYSKRLRIPAMM